MSEAEAIESTKQLTHPRPHTASSLASALRALGVQRDACVLVHCSMRRIGWICGGVQALYQALRAAVGDGGTLVVPTMSSQLSDPAHWRNPPLPPDWVPIARAHMPAFDPWLTPTRMMGALADLVRTQPDAVRSRHPTVSFAAQGPLATHIATDHALDQGLGEDSPLSRLYDLGGQVLLLGVGHTRNSSLHLAEARASWPSKSTVPGGAPALVDGRRQWLAWEELDVDGEDFDAVGAAFEAARPEAVRVGRVGQAEARLADQPALVDFAVDWFSRHRD